MNESMAANRAKRQAQASGNLTWVGGNRNREEVVSQFEFLLCASKETFSAAGSDG
jgi:hypothetical protein